MVDVVGMDNEAKSLTLLISGVAFAVGLLLGTVSNSNLYTGPYAVRYQAAR